MASVAALADGLIFFLALGKLRLPCYSALDMVRTASRDAVAALKKPVSAIGRER